MLLKRRADLLIDGKYYMGCIRLETESPRSLGRI